MSYVSKHNVGTELCWFVSVLDQVCIYKVSREYEQGHGLGWDRAKFTPFPTAPLFYICI